MSDISWEERLASLTPARPCAVTDCPEPGIDRHHWAPGSLFGKSQDRWPTAYLCKQHHRGWHGVMTGYTWPGMEHMRGPDDWAC